MKKYTIKIFALCFILSCISACGKQQVSVSDSTIDFESEAAKLNNSNTERGDEEMLKLTKDEVKIINEKSNMLGCVLLSEAEEGESVQSSTSISNIGLDMYICDYYHDQLLKVQVILWSSDGNILGISPGDMKDVIQSKMNEYGFDVMEPEIKDSETYIKYDVIISFSFNTDDTIKTVSVSVFELSDSNMPTIN